MPRVGYFHSNSSTGKWYPESSSLQAFSDVFSGMSGFIPVAGTSLHPVHRRVGLCLKATKPSPPASRCSTPCIRVCVWYRQSKVLLWVWKSVTCSCRVGDFANQHIKKKYYYYIFKQLLFLKKINIQVLWRSDSYHMLMLTHDAHAGGLSCSLPPDLFVWSLGWAIKICLQIQFNFGSLFLPMYILPKDGNWFFKWEKEGDNTNKPCSLTSVLMPQTWFHQWRQKTARCFLQIV